MKKAEVSFPKKQATVTYDPKVTSAPEIIKVVENTPHLMGTSMKYAAAVHKAGQNRSK